MSDVLATINLPVAVTRQQVDDIMETALQAGGIVYWCHKVEVKDNDFKGGGYCCDVISRGGTLILTHENDEIGAKVVTSELTLQKFLDAIPKVVAWRGKTWEAFCMEQDAEDCDVLIQFALFGKIIFG